VSTVREEERAFEGFARDMDWIEEHAEELRRSYPEEYVAVQGGRVVGHSAGLEELMEELRIRFGEEKAAQLAIRYIYKEPPAVVL